MEKINSFNLVWEAWEERVRENPQGEAIVHWDALGESFRWSYGALLESAVKFSSQLIKDGISGGDVCALMIRHHRYFYPLYMGVALAGAIPAVLAYPNARLHPDKFSAGLAGMARKSGLDWILTERDLEPVVEPLAAGRQSSIKGILYPLERLEEVGRIDPDPALLEKIRSGISSGAPFLLQHSSGTTGLQKAVVISHRALLEHVKRYAQAIGLGGKDKVVSWLPLYHDMGLIAGFHLPLACGIPTVQIDPFQWVSAPGIFFHAIAREKATLAWLPNFAYNFMADQVAEREMLNADLSGMRMFISCGEVARPESLEKFFQRFQKYGVEKKSLAVSYAMAEAVFAVTQTAPGFEAVKLAVDRDALARKNVKPPTNDAAKVVCVSSGRPISGCALKIVDENGSPLLDGRVGQVIVQSVSLFDGYRNDPEKTGEALKDDWYATGDLGFSSAGEYYLLGRMDDVIIVAGVNIFPEDVEAAVNNVVGIIPGRAVAFGVDNPRSGTQEVCVAAETNAGNESEKERLKLAVIQAAMSIDVTVSRVYLVPPRWLVKSSSGKLSRKRNKERVLVEGL